MKFSLVIGTLNRLEAIRSCLESISKQTYSNYEVIIIDQSDNNETELYISMLNDKRIIYRHVAFKGLSKARNEAIRIATGNYICLMDDDAYYDMHYLECAQERCSQKKILSGYIFDTVKKTDFAKYKRKTVIHSMTLRDVMRTCPSAGLIIPMNLIEQCGCFDEKFGVGAQYGAGEETDLLLRGIKQGFIVEYVPGLKLRHPVPVKENELYCEISAEKLAKYYEGIGALYKKHFYMGGMKELKKCYLEIWIKFFIRRILVVKYNVGDTNRIIEGFRRGIKEYTSLESRSE